MAPTSSTTGTQIYLAPFFGRNRLQPEDMQAIVEHGTSESANFRE